MSAASPMVVSDELQSLIQHPSSLNNRRATSADFLGVRKAKARIARAFARLNYRSYLKRNPCTFPKT
jgi:hypothetical protein